MMRPPPSLDMDEGSRTRGMHARPRLPSIRARPMPSRGAVRSLSATVAPVAPANAPAERARRTRRLHVETKSAYAARLRLAPSAQACRHTREARAEQQ